MTLKILDLHLSQKIQNLSKKLLLMFFFLFISCFKKWLELHPNKCIKRNSSIHHLSPIVNKTGPMFQKIFNDQLLKGKIKNLNSNHFKDQVESANLSTKKNQIYTILVNLVGDFDFPVSECTFLVADCDLNVRIEYDWQIDWMDYWKKLGYDEKNYFEFGEKMILKKNKNNFSNFMQIHCYFEIWDSGEKSFKNQKWTSSIFQAERGWGT